MFVDCFRFLELKTIKKTIRKSKSSTNYALTTLHGDTSSVKSKLTGHERFTREFDLYSELRNRNKLSLATLET